MVLYCSNIRGVRLPRCISHAASAAALSTAAVPGERRVRWRARKETRLLRHFHYKTIQDRLGTSIGKTKNEDVFSLGPCLQRRARRCWRCQLQPASAGVGGGGNLELGLAVVTLQAKTDHFTKTGSGQ
eukprot:COSAG06_NODE_17410_length_942_cov_17.115065_1_plen_127_part_10